MVACVVIGACHVGAPRAPRPAAEERVAASMAAWGRALESGSEEALAGAEDAGGRFAMVYAGTKLAANEVPGGAKAVEYTIMLWVLQGLWPEVFGSPTEEVVVVLPTGALGPGLVAAGLVQPLEGGAPGLTWTTVPREQTLDRVRAASKAHQARLRERAAWTCRPAAIAKTFAPTEPVLVKAAALSRTIFAGWLADVDAIWIVRADCADGAGLFVVTGHVDARGATEDRVLAAAVLPR